ncbi:MAG: sialidase family protein [Planctomycetaceae bacterium]|nr:sialidase family protein [Planctomycetaceae bacterium]
MMRFPFLVGGLLLPALTVLHAADPEPLKIDATATLKTARLGAVDVPNRATLLAMHRGQYILHAARGKLTRVPVHRVVLPHDNGLNPQSTQVDLGPNDVVYVRQQNILCTSTDGGRTWTARPLTLPPDMTLGHRWKVLRDGTFLSVGCKVGKNVREPAVVWVSTDKGTTWTKRAEIPLTMSLPTGRPYAARYTHRGLTRLSDDTLLWAIDIRDDPFTLGHGLFCCRSIDGGHTWTKPALVHDWGSEGSAALTRSGRVLATLRYQRKLHPTDPPDLEKRNGSISKGWPWKHVFLIESRDHGLTWSRPRQLTTVFGQTFGYPAARRDGTVVVIHDTRYGPGPPGSRAMISHDEGRTWEDEVYYLDVSRFSGSYSASVVLKDDTLLTISGSSQAGNTWEAVQKTTDFHAIRWNPGKP